MVVAAYCDRLMRSLRVQDELVSRVERTGGEVLAVDVGHGPRVRERGSDSLRVNEELFWPAFGFSALAFGLGAWEKRRGRNAR